MKKNYNVAIIGGGPAGLTAGIYAGRAGKSVVIFERGVIGGQITYTNEVENFPGAPGINGAEFAMKLQGQAESFGAEIIGEEIVEVMNPAEKGGSFILKTSDESYEAKTVILATGLSHRRMGIAGEDGYIGKGISFCAVCDGMFFRNAETAVFGGGNTALEEAIFLSDICKKVTIIHRRDRFRGEQQLVDELKAKDNVEFEMNKVVSGLNGEKLLEGIKIRDTETGKEKDISVRGLFVAIGQIPNGEPFRELVKTDERGYYEVSEECSADIDGVFVAGDGRLKNLKQLTTAVSDGAVAATNACKYVDRLNGKEYI